MEDISIFTDKQLTPTKNDLKNPLGSTFEIWEQIEALVLTKYPDGISDWNYPGKKYGWSFRIKDKRRAIIYFLPRSGFFKVAFVFGDKALKTIMDSTVSKVIKEELNAAKKYVEGRGISIDVHNSSVMADIEQLIEIKLSH